MKKIITILAFLPSVVSAQVISDVNSLTRTLTSLGNTVIQILIAFAVIWIIFNVVRYIMAGAEKRKEFGMSILYGIVGLFIILSIWGLVAILTNSFRTQTTPPTQQFPQIPPPSAVR
ncbi:MAG: pilin [Patescibacteria group bacterium]